MSNQEYKTLQDLISQLDKNPEFRREYRRQAPYYDLLMEIIQRRKRLGMTQKELAEKAGTYQGNISKIESGEVDVRLSTLVSIAEALETRIRIWLVPYYDGIDDKEYQELFRVSSDSSSNVASFASGEARRYEVAQSS